MAEKKKRLTPREKTKQKREQKKKQQANQESSQAEQITLVPEVIEQPDVNLPVQSIELNEETEKAIADVAANSVKDVLGAVLRGEIKGIGGIFRAAKCAVEKHASQAPALNQSTNQTKELPDGNS